ncbi:anaphase-promoting complex subunit 2 [Copidosoma floridanum]|uniref:anaphase-promoting complex subunit 2 n=1 Tax=Copidosoma floridanum TaxID=29053 RepID=UPI000C6FA98F|nr:anaphase-promoting complex subunit 2 [Copidosoma floridanum]
MATSDTESKMEEDEEKAEEETEPTEEELAEEERLFKFLEYNFPILCDRLEPETIDPKLEATPKELQALSKNFCLQSLVVPKIEEHLRKSVAPKFWSHFIDEADEQRGFQAFTSSVNDLYHDSSLLLPTIKHLIAAGSCTREICPFSQGDLVEHFKLLIRSTLLSQIPLYHTRIIEHFYKTAFNVFCSIESSNGNSGITGESKNSNKAKSTPRQLRQPEKKDDELELVCEGCSQESRRCQCQAIVDIFHETNKMLIELDLLERLVGNVLTSLIHIRIESHVRRVCERSFDTSQLEPLEHWLETVVVNWLTRIYSGGSSRSVALEPRLRRAVNSFKQKLNYFLYETYTRARIEQLFNIVIEYPDSRAAVDDLRACLERTALRQWLVSSLRAAFKTRLLHPGVSTPDILTAYISAIKALRQLDPSGLLLETVAEPIKQYLRSREDTVRCVVSGLLDEPSASDLADELAQGGEALQLDVSDSFQESTEDWENWQPDPIDTGPNLYHHLRKRRVADILSMLIGIYGSQDLFVSEYRTLLADRLLSQLNYQTDRELRHLELLKRRFGEQQLHHCEVMIKDIYDSKRIDGNIQLERNYDASQASFSTSALILSAQFWPPFKEDWKLDLPDFVQAQLDRYVRAYEALKGNRTLCWKAHLGSVNLDIETRDRSLNLNVSPIHATIILHFQEQPQWSLEQLADLMHVPATVLRRKIGFWVSQALLVETQRDTFVLQEELSPGQHLPGRQLAQKASDEEAESVMASASDQREEELQVFWSYIVGMLTNLDSMPLERIHQMLKMFASQGSGAVECGLPELRHFLDKKVREHQLLFSGGLYKLPRP